MQLGLFRSDYLLHEHEGEVEIKQVEFNTISSSFGTLSQKAGELHKWVETPDTPRTQPDDRYLAASTDRYFGVSPHLVDKENYPTNTSLKELAAGLANGWKAYGKEDAAVLFVVQDGERNVFDQRWLEYELLEA